MASAGGGAASPITARREGNPDDSNVAFYETGGQWHRSGCCGCHVNKANVTLGPLVGCDLGATGAELGLNQNRSRVTLVDIAAVHLPCIYRALGY